MQRMWNLIKSVECDDFHDWVEPRFHPMNAFADYILRVLNAMSSVDAVHVTEHRLVDPIRLSNGNDGNWNVMLLIVAIKLVWLAKSEVTSARKLNCSTRWFALGWLTNEIMRVTAGVHDVVRDCGRIKDEVKGVVGFTSQQVFVSFESFCYSQRDVFAIRFEWIEDHRHRILVFECRNWSVVELNTAHAAHNAFVVSQNCKSLDFLPAWLQLTNSYPVIPGRMGRINYDIKPLARQEVQRVSQRPRMCGSLFAVGMGIRWMPS